MVYTNIIESNLNFKSLSYDNNPIMLILHHAEAKQCTIQDIHAWHLANGWSGCGYHFLVRKDGIIYRGRPENAVGAHCPNANDKSLGICAEGSYMTETMPAVQRKALKELVKYLLDKYKIKQIYGHKELYATSCPGTNFPLEEMKSLLNSSTPSPVEKDIHYVVCYNNDVDKRSALYLSEYLGCECINNSTTPFNYEGYYPICVGGGNFTSYMKLNLKGEDRYKTMLEVAKYIEGRR